MAMAARQYNITVTKDGFSDTETVEVPAEFDLSAIFQDLNDAGQAAFAKAFGGFVYVESDGDTISVQPVHSATVTAEDVTAKLAVIQQANADGEDEE